MTNDETKAAMEVMQQALLAFNGSLTKVLSGYSNAKTEADLADDIMQTVSASAEDVVKKTAIVEQATKDLIEALGKSADLATMLVTAASELHKKATAYAAQAAPTILPAKLVSLRNKVAVVELRFKGTVPPGYTVMLHAVNPENSKDFIWLDQSYDALKKTVSGDVTSAAVTLDLSKVPEGQTRRLRSGLFKNQAGYPPLPGLKFDPSLKLFDGNFIVLDVTIPKAAAPAPAPTPAPAPGPVVQPPSTSNPPAPTPPAPSPSGITYGTARYPLSADSPWNKPLPDDVKLANDTECATLRRGGSLGMNWRNWTVPIYIAGPNDPWEEFTVEKPGEVNGKVRIRVPKSAMQDPNNDGHLVILFEDIWREFYYVRGLPGSRTAWSYAETPINSKGVGYRNNGSMRAPGVKQLGWGPIRAYGGSGVPGLIQAGDLTTKQEPYSALVLTIDQSLLAYPQEKGRRADDYLYPASKDDGPSHKYTGGSSGILMGTRFAYEKSFDASRLPLAAQQIVAFGKKFGFIVADQSGGTRIGARRPNSDSEGQAFDSLSNDVKLLLVNQMRRVIGWTGA